MRFRSHVNLSIHSRVTLCFEPVCVPNAAVLNSSPRAPPLYIFFMSLLVNTPDSDNQLVRSALHEWTVFRLTCSLHSVHCSLLPEQGKAAEVYFTSEHSFMDLRCATSLRTDECDIIYVCKYIQFKFTSRTLQCTMNGIRSLSNWNHGGISCDVHFAGHLRSNRTNVWSDKSNIRNVQSGGARGLELRTAGLTLLWNYHIRRDVLTWMQLWSRRVCFRENVFLRSFPMETVNSSSRPLM